MDNFLAPRMSHRKKSSLSINSHKLLLGSVATLLSSMCFAGASKIESLDQWLDSLSVITASKMQEDYFSAPTSISVLTQEQIKASGATTIAEALRLIPGVFVNEVRNGYYSVHIRGLDKIVNGANLEESNNKNTLFMIDHRPVYSYLEGGIFWEQIGIALENIARIEVVRGGFSALYGPNAVTGVISVITDRPKWQTEKPASVNLNIARGTADTQLIGARFDYALPDTHWAMRLSLQDQQRERHQETFFRYAPGVPQEFAPVSQPFFDAAMEQINYSDYAFPNPKLATDNHGWDLFLQYDNKDDVKLALDFGGHDDESLKAYRDAIVTPFTRVQAESSYVNMNAYWHSIHLNINYNKNDRGIFTRTQLTDFSNVTKPTQTDASKVLNAELSHALTLDTVIVHSSLRIRDIDVSSNTLRNDGDDLEMSAESITLRFDKDLFPWRIIAGVNIDQYDTPDTTEATYQFIANYDIYGSHLLRISHSRSNRIPFVSELFYDADVGATPGEVTILGNPGIDLLQVDTHELGIRGYLKANLLYDIELWRSKLTNERYLLLESPSPAVLQYQNIPAIGYQKGVTLSLNANLTNKLNITAHVTYQKTDLEDVYTGGLVTATSPLVDTENKSTPSWFGGFSTHYKPSDLWEINVNGYFIDDRTHEQYFGTTDVLSKKIIFNTKIQRHVNRHSQVYLNMRNLFDSDDREFLFADETSRMLLVGAKLSLL